MGLEYLKLIHFISTSYCHWLLTYIVTLRIFIKGYYTSKAYTFLIQFNNYFFWQKLSTVYQLVPTAPDVLKRTNTANCTTTMQIKLGCSSKAETNTLTLKDSGTGLYRVLLSAYIGEKKKRRIKHPKNPRITLHSKNSWVLSWYYCLSFQRFHSGSTDIKPFLFFHLVEKKIRFWTKPVWRFYLFEQP